MRDIPKSFVAWFIFVAAVGLASLGFVAWAIYRIVEWVTAR